MVHETARRSEKALLHSNEMRALHRRTASASCLLLVLLVGCTGRAATTRTVTPPTGGASPTSSAASPATSASQLRIVPTGYRLPAPVQRAVAVSFGGSIYIAGGLDAAGNSAAGVFRLNPANGRIASIGSLPQAFHDGAGPAIGRSLFVFGGGTAQSSATVQAIDLPSGRSRVAGRSRRRSRISRRPRSARRSTSSAAGTA